MQVIINADDFGLTKGVTDGIIHLHRKGIITSTSLMMNGRAVTYAVEQAKKNHSLRVGIHLVLSWGKPLIKKSHDLTNERGNFKYTNTFQEMEPPNVEQVKEEWQTQIEAFIDTGLSLNHIDSHHHIHGWEPIKQITIELAQLYKVPVRYVDSLKNNKSILRTEHLYTGFYGDGVSEDIFLQLKKLEVESVEVMTHPAILDAALKEVSSYSTKRAEELQILQALEIPDWVSFIS